MSPLGPHFDPSLSTVDLPSFSKPFPFSASVTLHLQGDLLPLCLLVLGTPISSVGAVLCAPQPEQPLVLSSLDYYLIPVQCDEGGVPGSALGSSRSSHWRVCLAAHGSKWSSSLSSTCAHQTAHVDAPWEFQEEAVQTRALHPPRHTCLFPRLPQGLCLPPGCSSKDARILYSLSFVPDPSNPSSDFIDASQ